MNEWHTQIAKTHRLKPINNECFTPENKGEWKRTQRDEERKSENGKIKWMPDWEDLAFNIILNSAIHCLEFGMCKYLYVYVCTRIAHAYAQDKEHFCANSYRVRFFVVVSFVLLCLSKPNLQSKRRTCRKITDALVIYPLQKKSKEVKRLKVNDTHREREKY